MNGVAAVATDQVVVTTFAGKRIITAFAVDDVVSACTNEQVKGIGFDAILDVVAIDYYISVVALARCAVVVDLFLEVASQRDFRCGRNSVLQGDA